MPNKHSLSAYFLPLGFAGLGVASAAIAIAMNSKFSVAVMGQVDELSGWLAAASSITVDVATVMTALAVGALYRGSKWIAGTLVTFAMVLFAGYSLLGNIGYSAASRIVPAEATRKSAELTAQTASEIAGKRSAAVAEHAAWLRARADNRELPRLERELAVSELRSIATFDTWSTAPVTVNVVPDAQAMLFSNLLSSLTGVKVSEQTIQTAMVAWLAVLLVLGKVVGGFCSSYLWPAPARTGEKTDETGQKRPKIASGEAAPVPSDQSSDQPTGQTSARPKTSDPLVSAHIDPANDEDDFVATVGIAERMEAFAAKHVSQDPRGRIPALDLYETFVTMSGSDASQRSFGKRLTRVLEDAGIDVQRERYGASGNTAYAGIALSPEAEAIRKDIKARRTLAPVRAAAVKAGNVISLTMERAATAAAAA